ncbi:MAG: oligopeptide/dipeptide ABC transporter ATP-binding protein, partial [Pseudomonadota bacterium]
MSHPQTLDDTPPASTSAAQAEPLLAAEGLTRRFAVGRNLPLLGGGRTLTAVSDVSFRVAEGETVGLVGESGCGKSTIGKLALGLLAPSAGKVLYRGELIPTDQGAAWRALRRQMQMVFQNPYGALNPRLTVGSQVRELLDTHDVGAPAERSGRVDALFEQVGLRTHMKGRYPHQMSGGQLQRAVIARALAVSPSFIVCDEAVDALDVSIQAQVINLLQDLQAERGLTYLFISHDLGVVRHVCDRILVMYLGRLVEEGPVDALFAHPRHPYTAALLDAAPDPDPAARRVVPPLQGDPPSPLDPPSGC